MARRTFSCSDCFLAISTVIYNLIISTFERGFEYLK